MRGPPPAPAHSDPAAEGPITPPGPDRSLPRRRTRAVEMLQQLRTIVRQPVLLQRGVPPPASACVAERKVALAQLLGQKPGEVAEQLAGQQTGHIAALRHQEWMNHISINLALRFQTSGPGQYPEDGDIRILDAVIDQPPIPARLVRHLEHLRQVGQFRPNAILLVDPA